MEGWHTRCENRHVGVEGKREKDRGKFDEINPSGTVDEKMTVGYWRFSGRI